MRSFFGAEKFPEWGQNTLHHWNAPRLANQLVSCSDRHIPYICVMLRKPKDPERGKTSRYYINTYYLLNYHITTTQVVDIGTRVNCKYGDFYRKKFLQNGCNTVMNAEIFVIEKKNALTCINFLNCWDNSCESKNDQIFHKCTNFKDKHENHTWLRILNVVNQIFISNNFFVIYHRYTGLQQLIFRTKPM